MAEADVECKAHRTASVCLLRPYRNSDVPDRPQWRLICLAKPVSLSEYPQLSPNTLSTLLEPGQTLSSILSILTMPPSKPANPQREVKGKSSRQR